MEIDSIEYIFQSLILLAVYVVSPILFITFAAAVIIGVIQSMMQIQEQTLSFAPKMIIVAVLLLLTSSAMFDKIVETIKEIIG